MEGLLNMIKRDATTSNARPCEITFFRGENRSSSLIVSSREYSATYVRF
jgi:hypothetical protein